MIYIRLFLSSIFFVFPSILHAASFDCEKAVSKIEKIICLDREVSDLDSNLGRLFYLLKGGSKSIVEDQKNWLKNTRDKHKTLKITMPKNGVVLFLYSLDDKLKNRRYHGESTE